MKPEITHAFRDGRHDLWRSCTAEEAARVREYGFEVVEIGHATKQMHAMIAQEVANDN